MPHAYIIVNSTISNPEQYAAYRQVASKAIEAYGAEVCIRGGAIEVLEGDWTPDRVVLLKFPSTQRAREFYNSPEYSLARQAREGAAVMRMVLVEGI